MTQAELDAMKAAFAAKGGQVTQAAPGLAYGVNAEADKAKRAAEKERARWQDMADFYEREAEQAQQRGVEESGYYKS